MLAGCPRGALGGAAVLGFLLLTTSSASPARADIPSFDFTAEQQGRNVLIEARPEWYCTVSTPASCEVTVWRQRTGGETEKIYEGDPGDDGLRPLGNCRDGGVDPCFDRCERRCRLLEDVCPLPGATRYTVQNHGPYSGYGGDDTAWATIEVEPRDGGCQATPGNTRMVIEDDPMVSPDTAGCGCQMTARDAVVHASILGLFLMVYLLTGRRQARR
jgi:hypothetical protein